MSLVHYLPPSPFIWAACGETDIRNGGSDVGKVTCFACRKTERFKTDQIGTDVRPPVTKGNAMGASIEWGHARSTSVSVLAYDEEAGDHQSISDDSDNREEVGLAFGGGGDGFILVGTPIELLAVLRQATSAVINCTAGPSEGTGS